MNWLAIVLVGGAAAWFEYNYQRSRRRGKSSSEIRRGKEFPVPESAHVEEAGAAPSISPGSENDKKLNASA